MYELVIGAVIAALFFDFINGFHDAANAIATIVGTRILRPIQAVTLAAIANFAGPFIFGVAVATTVGKGIVDPSIVTVYVIIAGLIGGIVWDIITWLYGLPTSSSHALIGGLVGAGLVSGGIQAIVFEGLNKVLAFMVVSPLVGLALAFGITLLLLHAFKWRSPYIVNKIFGRLQIVSSAFFSLTHGANDGQKTMGVITAVLLAESVIDHFYVPFYVILMAAAAISLGTFFGGWRIVKTMAFKITNLRPYQGFSAETGGGVVLTFMAHFGIPVSTTHAISGAIMGTGATKRLSAVRWGIGKKIVWAWIITIPASAAIGAAAYKIMSFAGIV